MNVSLSIVLTTVLTCDLALGQRVGDFRAALGVALRNATIATIASVAVLGTDAAPVAVAMFLGGCFYWYRPEPKGAPEDLREMQRLSRFVLTSALYCAGMLLVVIDDPWRSGLWGRHFADIGQIVASWCSYGVVLILVVFHGADFVALLVGRCAAPVKDKFRGIPGAGQTIGMIERFLIFILIMNEQFSGVGFLMTAKSILRIGDIRDDDQRIMAEYVIIGTFVSFGWAIVLTVVGRRLLGPLLP